MAHGRNKPGFHGSSKEKKSQATNPQGKCRLAKTPDQAWTSAVAGCPDSPGLLDVSPTFPFCLLSLLVGSSGWLISRRRHRSVGLWVGLSIGIAVVAAVSVVEKEGQG